MGDRDILNNLDNDATDSVSLGNRLNAVVNVLTVCNARLTAITGALPPGPPNTPQADALRQILFPRSADALLPLWLEVVLLAVLVVLFIALACWCLAYLERRAREEGRLTVRGQ